MSSANTYIGVDLHKKTCYMTVMDKVGVVSKQTEIKNDRGDIEKFFKIYSKETKVAVESTMNWIPFTSKWRKWGLRLCCLTP